tara:strand:- start:1206 stop:1445 length:240 start_codon:yes stop_codon:yes gene_type:complete
MKIINSIIIAVISSFFCYVLNYDNDSGLPDENRNKKYASIFCTIMIVSLIVLYITTVNQGLIPVSNPIKNSVINNTPPF